MAVWEPRVDNPFHGRLLRDGGRYAFWASDAGWYLIDPAEGSIMVTDDVEPFSRELRLFGIPAAVLALEAGDIPLHASAVEVFGRALLLAGPSRQGKTTLAAAFAAAGHRLLAEDTVRCALRPTPSIYPGPAAIRLRPDVAPSIRLSGVTTAPALLDGGRTPLVFDTELRGSGASVPLHSILLLREHAAPPMLRRVAGAEAVRDLFALAFRLPTDASRAASFARIVDLAASVEVSNLWRPKTIESLPAVVALMEDFVSRA